MSNNNVMELRNIKVVTGKDSGVRRVKVVFSADGKYIDECLMPEMVEYGSVLYTELTGAELDYKGFPLLPGDAVGSVVIQDGTVSASADSMMLKLITVVE